MAEKFPEKREEQRRKANLATARFIPVFLALITAYGSYVITGPLSVEYLLNPPSPNIPRRVAVGLAIPIAYYCLLIPVIATWIRLLVVVLTDPGYAPRGTPIQGDSDGPAPGLEEFYHRDVFVCDPRGFPIWCVRCNNWKPDRAHHNQDVDRCTLKMDHFCPWVGGVVGERSYKFFVQFCFYICLLTAYATVVLAYYVAEDKEGTTLKIQWVIALGLAGFFCLFTGGMTFNSVWLVCQNCTTIEHLTVNTRTMLLAVLLPPELQGQTLDGPPIPPQSHHPEISPSRSGDSQHPLTSELDDSAHSSYFSTINTSSRRSRRLTPSLPYQSRIWKGTVTYPLHLPTDRPPLPAPTLRTFAILETLPGMNPWNLGSKYLNFTSVFGTSPHDWLFPVKHSPCTDHSSLISQFPLGPDFQELLIEAGLASRPSEMLPRRLSEVEMRGSAASRRRRRKKRRLDAGWQNGERPDGWISEKEARRRRNESRRKMHGAPPPPSLSPSALPPAVLR